MAQTTKKGSIRFPEGAMVEVLPKGESTWFDVGAIESDINNSFEWEENRLESGNAGPIDVRIRNMMMAGGFSLINLDTEGITKLGANVFTREVTAGSQILAAAISDQIIPANWDDGVAYPLEFTASAAVSTPLRFSAAPAMGVISLDPAPGTPEELTVWSADAAGDYTIIEDSSSFSGYSIIFNSLGMAAGSPKTKKIEIKFGNNTPIASTTIFAGSTVQKIEPYGLRFTSKNSDDKIVARLELFAVDSESGGFQFNFLGAQSDGVEVMPITFKAKLDTSRDNGKQLMSFMTEL